MRCIESENWKWYSAFQAGRCMTAQVQLVRELFFLRPKEYGEKE